MSEQKADSDVNGGELLNLKALAENRSGIARGALFDRVAGLLFAGEGELPPEVCALIDQILTGLIHHVEADVRKRVAERLSSLKSAPHDLIKLLASDTIEIARPILHHSPVLTDGDLVEIVQTLTTDHRMAVAMRPEVAARVSAALAAAKEPQVLQALLANLGAIIPRAVLGDLVALSKSVEGIRKPLLSRRDMPKDIAHRMFWFVSGALRHTILDKFSIDAGELDAVLATVLAEKDAEMARKPCKPARSGMGEINALIAKVKSGDMKGFTVALAGLIGVEAATAAKIVGDVDGEALAIACKALGADRSQFTTIFLQLDYKRFGQARPASHVQNVSKIYDLLPQTKAQATVSLWNAQDALAA
jgi:uncharacterized protein (DUF2336 family)